jgi:hypothetical protein
MSGALPTARAPAQLSISSWSPTLVSRTFSGKTQRRQRGGHIQRWKLHVVYGTMESSQYLDLWAFLNAQRGQYGTFTITLPTGIWPRGPWTGTPLANGASAAGASSIPIKGLSNSITAIGKNGDFIQFAGHSKVYQLTADINSDGSGNATVPILPNLVTAVADGEGITVSAVPFTCILAGDEQGLDLQPPTQGVIQFDAIEDY